MTKSMKGCLYNDYEKGDVMFYEIYVDSLFLVNFVMNLYLLLLVNQSMFRTATRLRVILGAAVGAVLYLIPFLWSGYVWLKLFLGLGVGTVAMLFTAFHIRSIRAFWQILERLFLWSLLMGGTLLFLIKRIPYLRKSMTGIAGVLGMGTVIYLIFTYFLEHRKDKECVCPVTLICGGTKIKVYALIDSGNSLIEPISGKPVSIIETQLFESLWKEAPLYYRAIPFHSIGKKRGILQGYLLSEIRIEIDGVEKICKDVYVAVCDEQICGMEENSTEDNSIKEEVSDKKTGIRMILNPALLEG